MITKREAQEELKEVKRKIGMCYARIDNTKLASTEQKIKQELKVLEARRDELEALIKD